jgi:hypothetical protein
MQSEMMTLARQIDCAPKTFNGMACAVIIDLIGFATQGFWDVCPQ